MYCEEGLLHPPCWMVHRGDRRSLCPDSVSDIEQKEGSGGPPPVASQSPGVCGQYLTSYVSL